MKIEIDTTSGFCFGVTNAIKMAENILNEKQSMYCLGDIVHNNEEVERLNNSGLITIDHEEFKKLKDVTVLIRAHGEPPSTYETAKKNDIKLIDATCPVVLRLQEKIKQVYNQIKKQNGQIVIFGKHGHAEVNGLLGQTDDTAIVVMNPEELEKIDFSKPLHVFSQTTRRYQEYKNISDLIRKKKIEKSGYDEELIIHDTICPRVSGREPGLAEFAKKHDVIVFVSGKKSSNGKMLYKVCKTHNDFSYFVNKPDKIRKDWFKNANSVGVSGATSTPMWLMQQVYDKIKTFENE